MCVMCRINDVDYWEIVRDQDRDAVVTQVGLVGMKTGDADRK